ncbi:hypothetical protein Sm713_64890 [Streptomyces sp. TS71-3]|nr:hypothetical protein Sm713_64890 [Streptomyces sp. TS71-3]
MTRRGYGKACSFDDPAAADEVAEYRPGQITEALEVLQGRSVIALHSGLDGRAVTAGQGSWGVVACVDCRYRGTAGWPLRPSFRHRPTAGNKRREDGQIETDQEC